MNSSFQQWCSEIWNYILNPFSVWHVCILLFLIESFISFLLIFWNFTLTCPLYVYISLTELRNRYALAIWKCKPFNYGKFSSIIIIIFFYNFLPTPLLVPPKLHKKLVLVGYWTVFIVPVIILLFSSFVLLCFSVKIFVRFL